MEIGERLLFFGLLLWTSYAQAQIKLPMILKQHTIVFVFH